VLGLVVASGGRAGLVRSLVGMVAWSRENVLDYMVSMVDRWSDV
jgi:hypothetical protein